MNNFKHLYSEFLAANQGKHHFTSHSHHYWPDVTKQAILEYWNDSATMVDEKWSHVFGKIVPETQQFIAEILNTRDPEQIVFAPNTHELVYRLLSCFELSRPIKVLTTDSEFYSFSRQIQRMEESGLVEVTRVPSQGFADFDERFIAAAQEQQFDMVFFSQVFFNSGIVVNNVNTIVKSIKHQETMVVIDGYHGFMAMPTDLSALQDRVFYLSGGYKYAQAGEGACFMHVPKECQLRPRHTGWFAEFGALSQSKGSRVEYSPNGNRFAGATMDYSAIYKLHAVLGLFNTLDITVSKIHQHVSQLQTVFLASLDRLKHSQLNRENLLHNNSHDHGHFLTFELGCEQKVIELAEQLKARKIFTDYRGSRIRFGFAMHHDLDDCDIFRLMTV